MYNTVFDKKLDISGSYCDIYLHWANVEDLNNARDEIPSFKLHDIMGYLSLCYLTIEEYKI